MRRVLITAVVNSRLIYHRYTRYLCVCVYARIPREELEGRCVHYVTRRYHLAHIYIAMILARVTRAGVTAAEPPSPGLSPASSPNFLRVSDLTRHGSFARFHRILTSFFIRRIRTKVSFKCTRIGGIVRRTELNRNFSLKLFPTKVWDFQCSKIGLNFKKKNKFLRKLIFQLEEIVSFLKEENFFGASF